MLPWEAVTAWLPLAGSLVLFLLSAKAHGRQLRAERELEGVLEVDFRQRPQPPFVEALWRQDRIRFWLLFPAVAAALVGYVALAVWQGLPLPDAPPMRFRFRLAHHALLALLGAAAVAFTTLGLASLQRLHRALGAPVQAWRRIDEARRDRPAWLARTLRGSYGWWSAVFFAAAAVVAALIYV